MRKAIVPQRQNLNKHRPRGMSALERSIQEDGWIGAITAAADGESFDGSARIEVGAAVGFDFTPEAEPLVVKADGTRPVIIESDGSQPVIHKRIDIPTADDPRAKRLGYAANRIAELNLDWDAELLAQLAQETDLSQLLTKDELAALLASVDAPEAGAGGDDFEVDKALEGPCRVASGDLWLIDGGRHRLLCGDSTDAAAVARLMGNDKPLLMVTDPPYGVEYDPTWRAEAGINKNKMRMGVVANDDRLDWREVYALFGAQVLYVWHDHRFSGEVKTSLEAAGYATVNPIVWCKDRFALSRGDYHWQHEACWYAVRSGATHNWQGARDQSTAWHIRREGADEGEWGHGTQKPLECMQRPIENNSTSGDIIVDPFLGSGTTLIAAHRTGRRCFGMEIEPKYASVVLARAEAEGLPVARAD